MIMISLCLTSYNRDQMTFNSFKKVLNDDRISEIVIVDDCSEHKFYNRLQELISEYPKIKLFRNEGNLDCYRNKREAISKATNEWVIILDSDNEIDETYLNRIETFYISGLNRKFVYQPCFAKPHFNFTAYSDKVISKHNVARYMGDSTFQTMLNAMNYFVNRDEFLSVWDGSVDPVTSDSLFHNYNWINSGRSIYIVDGLEYNHLVHNGSHYQNNVRRTPRGFHESLIIKLKNMN